ncbi:ATP-binding protein [uncultured Serratia sp.]|uniref:ATP-binding protein n=1 Tax=uncultured Serratia sp. TaxID=239175 RepID=UPI00258C21BE|nr:ATP-binding protein [uncultured Serratia sp.]
MVTARSFGNYDLAAALADLIDNSIKAKATRVDINFELKKTGKEVVVRIRDNGLGMTLDALRVAMRPASTNPEDEREPDDLGRFGWGLNLHLFRKLEYSQLFLGVMGLLVLRDGISMILTIGEWKSWKEQRQKVFCLFRANLNRELK